MATAMTYYTGKHYIQLAPFLEERAELCGMRREYRIQGNVLSGYRALLTLRAAEHMKGLCERATCGICWRMENQ